MRRQKLVNRPVRQRRFLRGIMRILIHAQPRQPPRPFPPPQPDKRPRLPVRLRFFCPLRPRAQHLLTARTPSPRLARPLHPPPPRPLRRRISPPLAQRYFIDLPRQFISI